MGVHGHRGGLHDRRVGIDVDDQAGQGVAFPVDHAKGIAIKRE